MNIDVNTSCLGAISRVFWLMLGPLLLLPLAWAIIGTGNGWLTNADFSYLIVLAGIMLARWFEFLSGNPKTAAGLPATSTHLQRFLFITGAVGGAIWIVANVLGNYVLA